MVRAGIPSTTSAIVAAVALTGAVVGTHSEEHGGWNRPIGSTETNTNNSVGALLTAHGSSVSGSPAYVPGPGVSASIVGSISGSSTSLTATAVMCELTCVTLNVTWEVVHVSGVMCR